jgi:hypothetical protein
MQFEYNVAYTLIPNKKGVFLMVATIKTRQEATSWQKKFDIDAPKVGDMAPDFELWDINGENSVRLSDFRGQKPVALIFGSFT